jgi:hypothetical protein
MNWRFYIDGPERRALEHCGGSMDKGDGYGFGRSYGNVIGEGDGDGYSWGYGRFGGCGGGGWGNWDGDEFDGDGVSASEWK